MKATGLILIFIALSFSLMGQVVINEVCPANADLIHDPDFFDFSGWVELHNKGNASINISNFSLTNEEGNRGKWRIPSGTSIPAKGHLIIWCDNRNTRLHTNFNLDPDGETLILSNSSSTEVDRITFPEQYTNISFGRITDGGNSLGYLVKATPGTINQKATGEIRLERPELSLESGRYAGNQSLLMSSTLPDTQIRFTVDGSEPNEASSLYEKPVTISATVTIKAKAFSDGFLPSETEIKTFFVNEHVFTLPVISLSTKPSFLWDNKIGIYADGTNGISGNCQEQPRNWNQDWDRHAVFEYFEPNGTKLFDQNIDIRIGGACSRNNPQKSFAIKARDKYGSKTIEHDFFATKQISKFGGLMLRNAGNDFYSAMFRDAMMQTLAASSMDIDFMAYQPAIVYLNGAYWGIQNIREKIDGDYIESNFGVDKNDVDLIETYGNAIEGTSNRYAMYLDSLQKIDRSKPEAFAFINRYIDVQEFVNYLTAEIYYCNTDWPGNNIKFWGQRSTKGKFRWILWDLDFGFALYDGQSYATHPTLDFATDPDNADWPNPAWSTLHLRLLLQNPDFKSKLVQTLTTSLSTSFKPEKVIGVINTFQNNINKEMPHHVQRWQLSMDNWNNQVERLRMFASQRNEFMKNHIGNFFGYSDNVRISTSSFPLSSGYVQLNGIATPGDVQDAFYYRDLPYELIAEPSPGYVFSHYKIRKRQSTNVPLITKESDWKYNDTGTQPSADWTLDSFNDASWSSGQAELGYGDGQEKTVVGFGPNAGNKYITTYFRKTFTVDDTVGYSALSGSVLYDDGVVLYLNGHEVFRSNLPEGAITINTLASLQNSENSFFPFVIPKGIIKPGINVLSAEIHQNSNNSSDISFDLDLRSIILGAETEYITSEIQINDIANSDVMAEAYFVPVVASSGLIINEVAPQNSDYEDETGQTDDWIEIYNSSQDPIDIANYYITDKLSNKLKHKIAKGKKSETIVMPGEYKILWADGDVMQGPLHLSFKLSGEGEQVGMYQMVGDVLKKIDEVTFGIQPPLGSFSRIPNITGPFASTSRSTPLAENIFEVPTGIDEIENEVTVYPNPTTGLFKIEVPEGNSKVEIFNAQGLIVQKEDNYQGSTLSLLKESQGFYYVRVIVNEKVVTRRLMKIN